MTTEQHAAAVEAVQAANATLHRTIAALKAAGANASAIQQREYELAYARLVEANRALNWN